MMSENVGYNPVPANEGLCGECAHKEICVYRDRYAAAQAAVDKLLYEVDWAMPLVVRCKHNMVRPVAMRETTGENKDI